MFDLGTYLISFLELLPEPSYFYVLEHTIVVVLYETALFILVELVFALLFSRVVRKGELHFVRDVLLSPYHFLLRSSEGLFALRHYLLTDMRGFELGITPAAIMVFVELIHIIVQILSIVFVEGVQIVL